MDRRYGYGVAACLLLGGLCKHVSAQAQAADGAARLGILAQGG